MPGHDYHCPWLNLTDLSNPFSPHFLRILKAWLCLQGRVNHSVFVIQIVSVCGTSHYAVILKARRRDVFGNVWNRTSRMSIEISETGLPKGHPDHLEEAEAKALGLDLSPEHQAFLIDRHGTVNLDPIPSIDPADPYNWPSWKKGTNLALVAFHAFMGTFSAAGIIPAFQEVSEALDVSLQRASYLVSLQIAILGGAPLLWKPLSHRFGRRPIFLLSLILSCVSNVGCAKSPDYASMAACRALVACFISPAMAIGSAVVMETYFQHERARYMGIWTMMVTLGIPIGPLIFGFVANRAGYVWIYWILAIVSSSTYIGPLGLC